jgi:hypothetical protein
LQALRLLPVDAKTLCETQCDRRLIEFASAHLHSGRVESLARELCDKWRQLSAGDAAAAAEAAKLLYKPAASEITTCGHMMHFTCWHRHLQELKTANTAGAHFDGTFDTHTNAMQPVLKLVGCFSGALAVVAGKHAISLEQHEFLCPLCKSLGVPRRSVARLRLVVLCSAVLY